jgi:cohesin loading factor subunit SCC2
VRTDPIHPHINNANTVYLVYRKASRWVPGKKSAAGDKPAVVRHDKPIAWDRVVFATRAGKTAEDARMQEEQLLELWAEDGITAEPDDFGE